MHVTEVGKKSKIPDYGDVCTLQEFEALVKSKSFIDYDGYGKWSDGESMWGDLFIPNAIVKPSSFAVASAPKGATHVVWFNK